MESLLGFQESTDTPDDNHKLVPWLNWDEWDFVRLSLFSSAPQSIATALRRVAAWCCRGCLPVVVEVTAAIVEVQQKDPHFRLGLSDGAFDSEETLVMLYTMAIMRVVNGVIDNKRKKQNQGTSIADEADKIGMPRMLVDIRHEGSHRELPSLQLLRVASVKALSWLKSYYWDFQKNALPYQRGKISNVRKEIRSRLRELAFILKVKHITGSGSSKIKGKCVKHHEPLIGTTLSGRNKFFSLMACKSQPSKSLGSRKQLTRCLRNLVRLYSFFSSDVISVLLEFLLRTSNSTDLGDSADKFPISWTSDVAQAVFDEWKPVISKLSKKEPEVLLSVLRAVLDMIATRKAIRDDLGGENFSLSQYDSETQSIGVLSSLFTWLLSVLQGLKSPHTEGQESQKQTACVLPEPNLFDMMRKCLHLLDPENLQLLNAAVLLCKMVDSSYLNEKLQKLYRFTSFFSRLSENNPTDVRTDTLIHEDKHIGQAAEKLELLKRRKLDDTDSLITRDNNVEENSTWTVVKSWNPCPLGMLPRDVGSSGCLPVLDWGVGYEHKETLNTVDQEEKKESRDCDKGETSCDIEMMDSANNEAMRVTERSEVSEPGDMNLAMMSCDGLKGRLLIGGFWQKVDDQELLPSVDLLSDRCNRELIMW